jgi:Tol biopolymer transport system component
MTRLTVLSFVLIALTLLPNAPAALAASIPPSSLVAYLDRGNNLWVSDDTGANARQITTTGGFDTISWSADGTRIATVGPYNGSVGVYITSPDPGFGLRGLTTGNDPLWAPDSTKVALIDNGSIKVFDREGTYIREAALGAGVISWSGNDRLIGYTQVISNPYGTTCPIQQLGTFDAVSGQTKTIAQTIGKFAWAGDGHLLIYVSAADGAIKSYDTSSGATRTLSTRLANPCGGPFFTDVDGERLFFLDYGTGGHDLVTLDVNSAKEQVVQDVPIGYPASAIPESYFSVDSNGRYAFVVKSFPTTVTRIDLTNGARTTLLTNDSRMFLGFSADHSRMALINVPYGKPSVIAIRDIASGNEATISNVGWLAWQASPVTTSAALAWDRTWAREDQPVASGAASRTWVWGPSAFATAIERYDNAPGGQRAVRYYDKSRMEINVPYGDQNSQWYVTNGLLAKELISGQMQVGDSAFVNKGPAIIPVAGDPDDTGGPSYATLNGVLNTPPVPVGSEIHATIDRAGNIGNAGPGGVHATQLISETNHTIADVFWNYLNSDGKIWNGSADVDGKLFDPTFFATGYPITEAYWAKVKVGGQVKDVLVQCFERRCLTYTPSNPAGWQVEMGNVGRHYYSWRYGG